MRMVTLLFQRNHAWNKLCFLLIFAQISVSREKHASICLVLLLFLALPSGWNCVLWNIQIPIGSVNMVSLLVFLPFFFLPPSCQPLSPSLPSLPPPHPRHTHILFFFLKILFTLTEKISIFSGRLNYFSCLSELCPWYMQHTLEWLDLYVFASFLAY